jgi:hypothetical protein
MVAINSYILGSENLKGRRDMGSVDVDGRLILKWISKKHNVRL